MVMAVTLTAVEEEGKVGEAVELGAAAGVYKLCQLVEQTYDPYEAIMFTKVNQHWKLSFY